MDPVLFGFLEMCAGLIGVGFGIGGLVRRMRGKPSRGPGDLATSWGLILSGLALAAFGFVQWVFGVWL
jgi:hypothetical protein